MIKDIPPEGCIDELDFEYTIKMEGYAKSSPDMNELGEIRSLLLKVMNPYRWDNVFKEDQFEEATCHLEGWPLLITTARLACNTSSADNGGAEILYRLSALHAPGTHSRPVTSQQ
ncbi:MAG: hypothetical protein ACE5K0_02305 [Candidatus Methanofastidiosia archaeon]